MFLDLLLLRTSGATARQSACMSLAAAAVLGACGSDSSTTTTSGSVSSVTGPSLTESATLPPVSVPPPSTLPFHFDGSGQGGSSPFSVAATGDYKVAWQVSGIAGGSTCTVSIGLSAAATSVTVVEGVQVGPTDTKTGTATMHLDSGTYRAVEGGGCAWSITVGAS